MNGNILPPLRRGTALVIAAAAALAALICAMFWPGLMVWDAIRQYGQALSGHYDDWHPPAMNWLWRQLLVFGPGPAAMLALQAMLYCGGFALLGVAATRQARRGLGIALCGVALLPVQLVLVGTILKDSLMAGALLVASGLIAVRRSDDRRLASLAAALLIGAATLRFNAMPACLPLALQLWPPRWRQGVKRPAIALIASAAVLLAAMPIANRLLHAERSGVALSLVIFDLGGITAHSGVDAFPPIGVADPVAVNARCYTPVAWDVYAWWVDNPCPIQFATIRDWFDGHHVSPDLFWARVVIHHPIAFAEHRIAHFNQNSRFIVDEHGLHPLSLQTDPNPWGFHVPPNVARDLLARFAEASLWTPLGWPLWWMAVAFAVVMLAPAGGLARPLAWSALLYGLSYLPLSVATEVRYHFWTTTAAALAAAMAIGRFAEGHRPSRSRRALAVSPAVVILLVCVAARIG